MKLDGEPSTTLPSATSRSSRNGQHLTPPDSPSGEETNDHKSKKFFRRFSLFKPKSSSSSVATLERRNSLDSSADGTVPSDAGTLSGGAGKRRSRISSHPSVSGGGSIGGRRASSGSMFSFYKYKGQIHNALLIRPSHEDGSYINIEGGSEEGERQEPLTMEELEHYLDKYPSAITEVDSRLRTVLHLAAGNETVTPDMVKKIIARNRAALHNVDDEGQIPLHHACRRVPLQVEVIANLLAFDPSAGVFEIDNHGRTALDYALRSFPSDAIPTIVSLSQSDPHLIRSVLMACAAASDERSSKRDLMVPFLQELFLHKPQIIHEHLGEFPTPLHFAISLTTPPEPHSGSKQLCYEIVEFLTLSHPASLSTTNTQTQIPIHLAIIYQSSLPIVKLLIHLYPEGLTKFDKTGKLPFDYAVKHESSFEVSQLLVSLYGEFHATKQALYPEDFGSPLTSMTSALSEKGTHNSNANAVPTGSVSLQQLEEDAKSLARTGGGFLFDYLYKAVVVSTSIEEPGEEDPWDLERLDKELKRYLNSQSPYQPVPTVERSGHNIIHFALALQAVPMAVLRKIVTTLPADLLMMKDSMDGRLPIHLALSLSPLISFETIEEMVYSCPESLLVQDHNKALPVHIAIQRHVQLECIEALLGFHFKYTTTLSERMQLLENIFQKCPQSNHYLKMVEFVLNGSPSREEAKSLLYDQYLFNVALLGDPGSGRSKLSQFLCQDKLALPPPPPPSSAHPLFRRQGGSLASEESYLSQAEDGSGADHMSFVSKDYMTCLLSSPEAFTTSITLPSVTSAEDNNAPTSTSTAPIPKIGSKANPKDPNVAPPAEGAVGGKKKLSRYRRYHQKAAIDVYDFGVKDSQSQLLRDLLQVLRVLCSVVVIDARHDSAISALTDGDGSGNSLDVDAVQQRLIAQYKKWRKVLPSTVISSNLATSSSDKGKIKGKGSQASGSQQAAQQWLPTILVVTRSKDLSQPDRNQLTRVFQQSAQASSHIMNVLFVDFERDSPEELMNFRSAMEDLLSMAIHRFVYSCVQSTGKLVVQAIVSASDFNNHNKSGERDRSSSTALDHESDAESVRSASVGNSLDSSLTLPCFAIAQLSKEQFTACRQLLICLVIKQPDSMHGRDYVAISDDFFTAILQLVSNPASLLREWMQFCDIYQAALKQNTTGPSSVSESGGGVLLTMDEVCEHWKTNKYSRISKVGTSGNRLRQWMPWILYASGCTEGNEMKRVDSEIEKDKEIERVTQCLQDFTAKLSFLSEFLRFTLSYSFMASSSMSPTGAYSKYCHVLSIMCIELFSKSTDSSALITMLDRTVLTVVKEYDSLLSSTAALTASGSGEDREGAKLPICPDGGSFLFILAKYNRSEAINKFPKELPNIEIDLDQENRAGNTVILEALEHGSFDAALVLLNRHPHGGQLNEKEGLTAVMKACRHVNAHLQPLKCSDILRVLLSNPSTRLEQTNPKDKHYTALHYLVQSGDDLQIIKLLVEEYRIDIGLGTADGKTALDLARELKHTAAVEYLTLRQQTANFSSEPTSGRNSPVLNPKTVFCYFFSA